MTESDPQPSQEHLELIDLLKPHLEDTDKQRVRVYVGHTQPTIGLNWTSREVRRQINLMLNSDQTIEVGWGAEIEIDGRFKTAAATIGLYDSDDVLRDYDFFLRAIREHVESISEDYILENAIQDLHSDLK